MFEVVVAKQKQKRQPLERIIPWWMGLSAKDTGEVEAAKTGHVWPHRKTQELDNQMTPPSNFFDPTRALGFHIFHMRPERNINIFRFPPIPSSFQIVTVICIFFAYCFTLFCWCFLSQLFTVCNGDLPRTAYH
jgi:hypothetical protein